MFEREQAIGRYQVLKKQIYELSIKAQSLVKNIHDEIEYFLTDKDFTQMNFKKVEVLSKELQQMQEEYKDKAQKLEQIKSTYNL